jgi:D-alanyl-D-alanine carboxypeptidase/D-alanyl-D-alanine-endopeptidase (penicillin-binding protein 4)
MAVVVSPGAKVGGPGVVALEPPIEGYKIVNKLVTGGKFRLDIAMKKEGGEDVIVVTGRIPPRAGPQKFYRSLTDPAIYAGQTIRYWLTKAGISVSGPVREAKTPAGAKIIVVNESQPLSEIIAQMNKRSNNFIAETLLKHLGAAKYGAPGSTAKGIMAVEGWLASIGIPKGNLTLENGSGLSDISRVSAKDLVKVLVAAYKNNSMRDAFVQSLSIYGVDGTTQKWRLAPELLGKVYVKTGTLDGVSALAGYAPQPSGRMAAFAILANSIPRGAWTAHEAQMEVVRAITEVAR